MPPTTPAGATVTVWTDQNGRITAEPPTKEAARLHAALGGVLTASGTGGAVLGAARVVRLGLDRQRTAQWAAEWEHIDTRKRWKSS
ncbi:hypothetical protein GCM10018980_18870 [Streptomyces capoamus]|uniref:Uncharacterized protein n=1 Tax=Streptomyces capoamus TaxID=68183 RepID=A0A919C3J6_9ACTN|nr:hypothetical protein [Streptomyces capoamus]GGW16391.1 hypothetical protein GCM10010501_32470 [Streptomyces libani subsp. rufus]GHG42724.1 hypothetical protein GCM10018980_18870 [Streptomyces capoamus]